MTVNVNSLLYEMYVYNSLYVNAFLATKGPWPPVVWSTQYNILNLDISNDLIIVTIAATKQLSSSPVSGELLANKVSWKGVVDDFYGRFLIELFFQPESCEISHFLPMLR